ncbi:MAG: 16S rRNA (adenine(1518)-N(6)/adenine(1519)-N(6))-dimethyltransferase RsmA, partial [Gammaproteobacteria bacterium]
VTIHEADALSFDFAKLGDRLRIVGNLPYNISTPLLFHLLKFRDRIVDMHFMLQKEVVERMAAPPGSKAYGRLGIMLGCHLQIEPLFDVDRLAFSPPPDVTSAVVRLDPLPAGTYTIDNHAALSELVTTAFMQRRKTLRNALKRMVDAEDFATVGIDAGLRPEQIAIAEYIALSNHMVRKS